MRRAFLFARCAEIELDVIDRREAPEMNYGKGVSLRRERESADVLRKGPEGVWWERGDGLQVRVAGPEREAEVERVRVSLLAVVLAYLVADRAPRR